MAHKIQLSTTLLIAMKTGKRASVRTQPSVAGIKVFVPQPVAQEKSRHTVNEHGNIIRAREIPQAV